MPLQSRYTKDCGGPSYSAIATRRIMSRENYLKSREALIAEEASYRFDRSSASAATALELRANELLSALRIPPKESNFLMAREAIEESKLFSVLRTCPKGALLHGHLDAMAPTAFLLRAALEHQELLWVKADRTVTEDDIQDRHAEKPVVVHFEWRPTSTPSATHQGVGLTDANYDASWIPVSQARANFKGGESVFDGFSKPCCSLPALLKSHFTLLQQFSRASHSRRKSFHLITLGNISPLTFFWPTTCSPSSQCSKLT